MTDIDPIALGLDVMDMLREGRFTDLCALFGPQLHALAPAETVRMAWVVELESRGPVVQVGTPTVEDAAAGLVRIAVPVACERGALTVVMSVDSNGQLAGFRLAAAAEPWQPPDYVHPKRFTEQDVTFGKGALEVPGTLSLPRAGLLRRRKPVPAVVLLAGGGPFDRDETSGRNKPLKDIAWGLASRGVAVVRFDKATYRGANVATMTDEYVPHAIAAVELLRSHPAVDSSRVFVLGHSMGGKVAPRVAAAAPSVAGVVVLAGDTQPMHWAGVRVARYLATVAPEAAPAVETIARQAELVDNLTASTPDGDLPLGMPASYWLDMRDYDPVALAATLDKPMFIGQGGRDYQVTVADDLAGWQAGLAARPEVTIRVYDADNHLFFPGSGPSTPAEYEPAQHVDPALITDIAQWLTSVA